jgi:nitrite reductase/ring-hydroxylating ferredoxin subunit
MSTPAPASPAPVARRSRLDPEPMPRRDFLGLAAIGSACLALGFATLGMLRLPKAAVIPAPSRRFRVSLPESLAPGAPFIPAGRSVAVFRDAEGVYAITLVCTHLGCIVKHVESGFDCPCHGSKFGADGAVTKGPAPKALAWLEIKKTGAGAYLVDEGKEVAPGTKVSA